MSKGKTIMKGIPSTKEGNILHLHSPPGGAPQTLPAKHYAKAEGRDGLH